MRARKPTDRRSFLTLMGLGVITPVLAACGEDPAQARTYPVRYTDAEWRKRLTPSQYAVLREEATERPFTSPLLKEHRRGDFACQGCGNRVYPSRTKYDSGTGWPSFWAAYPGSIATKSDHKLVYPRTEVHCARCGGHLGHIFDDGPPPTGKRHCINGVALKFLLA